jgi:hypothetical protein
MLAHRCSFFFVLSALLVPLVIVPLPSSAAGSSECFTIEILVNGRPVREYRSGGIRYIEALKGKDYAIRIHNPSAGRVAVALSVDGLNTIDARHTGARDARKWVIDPHETVTISGWQTSSREARRFYFTSEERSYAARLGQPENLGVISAVFFRERVARVIPLGATAAPDAEGPAREERVAPRAKAGDASSAAAHSAPAPAGQAAADEYAATGIGGRTEHLVRTVHLELEASPAARIDLRYEYRGQLARLGILPEAAGGDPLERRGRARGFAGGSFCPDIK